MIVTELPPGLVEVSAEPLGALQYGGCDPLAIRRGRTLHFVVSDQIGAQEKGPCDT
jgi:hypothetical protein